MTTLTIDTLALANDLKKAGTGDKQAEAMSKAIATGVSGASGELATKTDLAAELAKLEIRLTNRFYAVAAGLGALIVGQGALTIGILSRFVVGGE